MNKEAISEEFAKELIKNIQFYFNPDGIMYNCTESQTIRAWGQKGFIKQPREEEIREELKRLQDDISYRIDQGSNHQNKLYYELVEILDKRLEDK
jgi:hypothetical protein